MMDATPFAERNFRALETIYRFYQDIAESLGPWACNSGCSECCTALASLTSLEAAHMWGMYATTLNQRIQAWPDPGSLAPLAVTANELAGQCLLKEETEQQAEPSSPYPCPLLSDGRCLCYEARPLMCRVLYSSVRCAESGYAQMPPQLLSLSTVCLQLVENLDRAGCSGYLVHVLPLFSDRRFFDAYREHRPLSATRVVRPNAPNPGLLVPPEHQGQIRAWLRRLHEL
jgi:hypothetical protein